MSDSLLSQEEIQALIKQFRQDDSDTDCSNGGEEETSLAVESIAPDDGMVDHRGMAKTKKIVFNNYDPKIAIRKDSKIEEFNHVSFDLKVVLGEAVLTVGELLNLKKDSVVHLDRLAGENARLYGNDKYLAEGEIVVLNDCFAFRVHFMGEDKKEPVKKPQEEEA